MKRRFGRILVDAAGSSRCRQPSFEFVTLFFLVIDTASKELAWVRAGHDAAIVEDDATLVVKKIIIDIANRFQIKIL